MIPAKTPYEEIKKMAEALSANHLASMASTSIKVSFNNSMRHVTPVIISLGAARYQINITSIIQKLDIVDTRGALVHGFRNTGARTFIWNASGSGVYFLRSVSEAGTFITPFNSIVY
jgi:hypothetical protein